MRRAPIALCLVVWSLAAPGARAQETAAESPAAPEELPPPSEPTAEPPAPVPATTVTAPDPAEEKLSVRERALRRSTRTNFAPMPWDLIGAGAVFIGATVGSGLLYAAAWDDHVLLQQGGAWGRAEVESVAARGQLKLAGSIAAGTVAIAAVGFGVWRVMSKAPPPPVSISVSPNGATVTLLLELN